jgi:hypothetical protein
MPPAKKGGETANSKGGTNLVMPTEIRRNYLTRTYSGDNLLKSDKMSPARKMIYKSKQNLIWDNHNNLHTLPLKVERLDFKAEMKIFDIVFGEDPLLEGTTTLALNIKLAKQQQKNLENALSVAGKKRLIFKERYGKSIPDCKLKCLKLIIDFLLF